MPPGGVSIFSGEIILLQMATYCTRYHECSVMEQDQQHRNASTISGKQTRLSQLFSNRPQERSPGLIICQVHWPVLAKAGESWPRLLTNPFRLVAS